MKRLAVIGILFIAMLIACDDNDCPDDMEKCRLNDDGTEICVPKGQC